MKEWCDNLNYKMKTLQDKEEKLKTILEQHILFERILLAMVMVGWAEC